MDLKIRNYEILRKIFSELVRTININELLPAILDITIKSMSAESGSIMLVEKNLSKEEEPEELVVKAARGLPEDIIKKARRTGLFDGRDLAVALPNLPLLTYRLAKRKIRKKNNARTPVR